MKKRKWKSLYKDRTYSPYCWHKMMISRSGIEMKKKSILLFPFKSSKKEFCKEKEWDYYSRQEVKEEIYQVMERLKQIYRHFEDETNFDLIEADIWEMKSLEARCRQLLHQAKKMERNGWQDLLAGGTKH